MHDHAGRKRRVVVTAAEEAERIAQHAEQKASFAARDFEEKGRPYRADPLFAYLWDRGWGTGRYRAFPLVRMIDGWVARLAPRGKGVGRPSSVVPIRRGIRQHA